MISTIPELLNDFGVQVFKLRQILLLQYRIPFFELFQNNFLPFEVLLKPTTLATPMVLSISMRVRSYLGEEQ